FYHDTATPSIYTLSLHDALPISRRPKHRLPPCLHLKSHCRSLALPCCSRSRPGRTTFSFSCSLPCGAVPRAYGSCWGCARGFLADRKSTRLNSSHVKISYAVFCL